MYISVKLLSTNPITKKNRTSLACIIHTPNRITPRIFWCKKQPNSQITTEKTGSFKNLHTTWIQLYLEAQKIVKFLYSSNLLHINGQSHTLYLLRIPSQHFGLAEEALKIRSSTGIHVEVSSKWDQKLWVNLIWLICLIQIYLDSTLEIKECSLTILGQRHVTIILDKLGWYPSQGVESEAWCGVPSCKQLILEWP